jgi:hypothetical protein
MPIQNDALLSLWDIENMPACDEGMELARRFLEAAGECVSTLGSWEDEHKPRRSVVDVQRDGES